MYTALTALVLLCSASVHGAECLLPKGCNYLDSEFSTGGGNKPSYLMEVTCRMAEGGIVKFIDWKLTAGGLLGVGRFTAPEEIAIKPSNEKSLNCKY